MGCRVLHDAHHNLATLYDSVTDWSFGPVFYDDQTGDHDAAERADAFCRWVSTVADGRFSPFTDPRQMTEPQLMDAYNAWRDQEADQWQREDEEEREKLGWTREEFQRAIETPKK